MRGRAYISGLAIVLAAGFFFGVASNALACEMSFDLIGPGGEIHHLRPMGTAALDSRITYTLRVMFREDHRRCITPPEETIYLLDGERWREDGDGQPLRISDMGEWVETAPGSWVQEIVFTPAGEGKFALDIIRDCPKGGFDTVITFVIG
jgi:hypothetical protein